MNLSLLAQTEPTPLAPSGDETAAAETSLVQKFIDTFASMGEAAVEKAPYILIGISIFVVGFIIAKILRKVIGNTGSKIGMDAAAEKAGVSEILGKIGVRAPLSSFLATLVYFIVILLFLKVSVDFMEIAQASAFMGMVFAFIPKLLVAFIILTAGLLAAETVRKMVQNGLDRIGIEYSNLIANFAYGLLAVMILTVVLGQVGIETELLNAAVKIFLAAGSLAVALALGLGLRPIAKNVVAGVYARDTFPPGSLVHVNNADAKVVEVGAISTRLETENGDYFVVPNFLMVNQLQQGSLHQKADPVDKNYF